MPKNIRSKLDALNWEKVAPDYINFTHKEKRNYLQHLIYESLFSNILEMAKNVKGKTVLDAGCGEGRLARLLSELKGKVSGCDVSPTMISEAEKIGEANGQRINYFVHDLTKKLPDNSSYDLVVSNLVLFDVFDVDSAVRNISRSLKPGGRFIFSIIHPCFNSSKSQRYNLRYIGRGGGKVIFEINKSYRENSTYKADYRFAPKLINYYHRPIEKYVELLLKNSFLIDGLNEPTLKLSEIYDEKTYHQHYLPKFLIISAIKKTP